SLLQRRNGREFSGIKPRQDRFERLVPGERIEQAQEARLVGCGQKSHQPLRFIIKNADTIGRRMSYRDKRAERNQVLGRKGLRLRLGPETASTLITGVRVLGNELSKAFIQPAGNAVG